MQAPVGAQRRGAGVFTPCPGGISPPRCTFETGGHWDQPEPPKVISEAVANP